MENKEIMVSVIVPVKNMEKYIEKCVSSILEQEEKRIELIIVDFGSQDKTIEIIEKFLADSRVQLIKKELKDVAEARNIALKVAKGRYISFIDADDWVDRKFYETVINSMEKENTDIGICGYKNVNECDGQVILEKKFENYNINLSKENIKEFMIENTLGKINCEAWNKVYKREFIEQADVRFDSQQGINGEDLLFNALLYMNFPKIMIREVPLYYHLLRESSLGKINEVSVARRLNYVMETIEKYSKEKNLDSLLEESHAMQYLTFIIFQITNRKLKFKEKMNEYKSAIMRKEIHKRYMKLCIKSKHSSWKRKILAMILYTRLDAIFIIFSYIL